MSKYIKIEAYKHKGKIYETKEEVDQAREEDVARTIISIFNDEAKGYSENEHDKAMTIINTLLGEGVTSRKALEKILITIERLDLKEGQ